MSRPTLRSLGLQLGLSRTTISKALRGLPFVSSATARKVRETAQALGYRPNPLAGAIMSEMRRSHHESYRGQLALLETVETERPGYARGFHGKLEEGIRARAHELGFGLERFAVGPGQLTQRHLDRILQARSIRGVLLLPTWTEPDFLKLDWPRYAGIYLDYRIARPAICSVCCDHYCSMTMALERLTKLGYRRPGLILPRQHDRRLQHRWTGAFLSFQQTRAEVEPVPALIIEELTEEAFQAWFRRHRPDVVLGHQDQVIDWMKRAGADVPRTHGFFCLNLENVTRPCAGLDQTPRALGGLAAEMVAAKLWRNQYGIPAKNGSTTLPAQWRHGPTIRRVSRTNHVSTANISRHKVQAAEAHALPLAGR